MKAFMRVPMRSIVKSFVNEFSVMNWREGHMRKWCKTLKTQRSLSLN